MTVEVKCDSFFNIFETIDPESEGKPEKEKKGEREELTNQKNSGWTSVDRSTKATLSTYNTWIHVSRLQKIYHFQSLKLRLTTKPLTVDVADMQQGRDLMLDM